MKIVEGADYRVVLLENVPMKVKCWMMADEFGFVTVYANARYSHEMIREFVAHELSHITNDDVYSNDTADEIEKKRHG